MFIDAYLLLSDSQAITAAAVSTNVIDLGNAEVKRRVGTGEPMGLGIFVEVAGTGGPLTFNVIDSANADLVPDRAGVGRVDRGATHGRVAALDRDSQGQGRQRYLGMSESGTGTVTVTATVLPQSMFEEWTAYADAVTIS